METAETRQADEPSIATPTHESDERKGTQARTKGKQVTWTKKDVVEPLRAKKKSGRERGPWPIHPCPVVPEETEREMIEVQEMPWHR